MSLDQTKGKFHLVGKVVKMFTDEQTSPRTGNDYRKATFGVQTSPTNTVYVNIMGTQRNYVKAYSSAKKETIDVDWDDRHNAPSGYHVLGLNMFIEPQEKGNKFERKVLVEWDAIEYLEEHLSDDDWVSVRGELQFSEYERNGENTTQVQFTPRTISKLKNPVDFEADDFEETSSFEQDIVFVSCDEDREENKLYVNTYQIDYKENFVPAQYVIDGSRNEKFYKQFKKRIKFGDWLRVCGYLINKVEMAQDDGIEDDFGSEKPNGLNTVNHYTEEILITGLDVDTWKSKKYSDTDFMKSEAEENFGGDINPFSQDEDSDDDSLPF